MVKLLSILTIAAGIQLAISEYRNVQHVPAKLETLNVYLQKSSAQCDQIKSGETEVLKAAEDFIKTAKESVKFLNFAIKDNTLNNKFGKQLYEITHHGKEVIQWLENNLQNTNDLKTNLKTGIEKYAELVKDVSEAMAHIKESAENSEHAMNSFQDFIDNSLYLIKKLDYHLEFKKYTNSELLKNIHEILDVDLASLALISEKNNNLYELVIHAHQLKYFVNNLIDRLTHWTQHSGSKNAPLQVNVEKAIAELHEVTAGIQRHARPTNTLDNVKFMFKIWLSGTVTAVSNLDASSIGQTDDILRAALYDVVGVTMNFKSIFGYLSA